MQITYLSSACVLIKDQDSTLLCDPWLIDGEFYGSWCHYPPCITKPEELDDVDGIYISHVHPDHFSKKTLEKMNKKIPIYIHKYHYDFTKRMAESLGFNVIEIEHDKKINITGNLNLRILAADNCNPELCLRYYACGMVNDKTDGSTQMDTLCAIDNGEHVIVNTNDCPYPLAKTSAKKIKNRYNDIDFLLFGYSSASAFPQCFNLSQSEIENSKKEIIKKYLTLGESYINLFKPKFYMPFAGRYVLGGKNSNLNNNRAKIELEDALDYFSKSTTINHNLHKGVILNQKSTFDISKGESDYEYISVDLNEKNNYIDTVLSKRKYDYEDDENPKLSDFIDILPKCFERFEKKRNQLTFSSDTPVFIHLPENQLLVLHYDGKPYEIISKNDFDKNTKFLMIETDFKLLFRLLRGPMFAHWNNSEIGSHLKFSRNPNIYEIGLYYCLNFLHS